MTGTWTEGKFAVAAEAALPLRDRGCLYGEGLFETLLVWHGRPFRLPQHLRRMSASAGALGLPLPRPGWESRVEAAAARLAATAATPAMRLRLTLSAGDADALGDPATPPAGPPRLWLQLMPCPEPGAGSPIKALAPDLAGSPGSLLRQHKTLSRLENLLCQRAARAAGADEGLMPGVDGSLAGGTRANLFVAEAGALVTPPVTAGCLAGITRELLIDEVAPGLGISVRQEPLQPGRLQAAHEAFMTNSLWGIRSLSRGQLGVVAGSSGFELTCSISKAYLELLARECGTE